MCGFIQVRTECNTLLKISNAKRVYLKWLDYKKHNPFHFLVIANHQEPNKQRYDVIMSNFEISFIYPWETSDAG